jgi:hypothetical protein
MYIYDCSQNKITKHLMIIIPSFSINTLNIKNKQGESYDHLINNVTKHGTAILQLFLIAPPTVQLN